MKAQICVDAPGGPVLGSGANVGDLSASVNCQGFLACHPGESLGVSYTTPGCDPKSATCTLRARVHLKVLGTSHNVGQFFADWTHVTWSRDSTTIGTCGFQGAIITDDLFDTWVDLPNFTCSNPGATQETGTYLLEVRTCDVPSACPKTAQIPVTLTGQAAAAQLCQSPPPPPCKNCQACPISSGGEPGGEDGAPGKGSSGSGGMSVQGRGASTVPPGGSRATLLYFAGGVGDPQWPGATEWNPALGRYWSHDFAEGIVEDPDDSHVWLLTRSGGFVEYTDTVPGDPDGLYESVAPSDEYDGLFRTAGGWELHFLDGQVQSFDNTGRWTQTASRTGQASVATYSGGQLVRVDFPDGRADVFTYHPAGDPSAGKLQTVELVGIDGATRRVWTYTWAGDDLVRMDRPDGTAVRFDYGDPSHPGFMTQMTLVGTDTSERILRGWEYDSSGNATKTWRGASTPSDPNAVELWEYQFDDPAFPTVTTVLDPLGSASVYTLDRDAVSNRVRVLAIAGSCPACGSTPNVTYEYNDPAHPLRPTQATDGEGNITAFTYDANGQVLSRREAVNDPALTRETSWQYADPNFPSFPTRIRRPSVEDPLAFRETQFTYDGDGNLVSRVELGVEDALPFSLETVTTYNASGEPLSLDPPGFGGADVTSYTYDPTRGGFHVATRTDPIVGAQASTSFAYDVYNRRTSVTDVNDLETLTEYDELDRVVRVIQKGLTPAEDLLTENIYNAFGDLFQTVLPRGNVLEYAYDSAGRLISMERKPDAQPTSHGERTLYTLDAVGNRTLEELQRWNGTTWVTDSATGFVYLSRCHLDQVIAGVGSPNESITEYEYDCEGDLQAVWDPNRDRAVHPPSTSYTYDALDRLVEVSQPWAGGGDAVTSYGYDVQDHLVRVTDAEGSVTTYAYSDRDLLMNETSEVAGTTTYGYNEHGELVSQTDARGITVGRGVDALDRVTSMTYPTPSLNVTYTYDGPTPNALGRLTRISRASATVDYEYDLFGRMTRDGDLSYAYDGNGNRSAVTYPGGLRALYGFDFADRQDTLSVEEATGTQELVTSATYLPFGPLASVGLGNAVVESREFDSRYRPQQISLTGPRVRTLDYQTDAVGNVTQIAEASTCGSVPDLVLQNQTVSTTEVFESCASITASDFQVEASGNAALQAAGTVALGSGFSVASEGRLVIEAGADLSTSRTRTYEYQDVQYFLTGASGPWGALEWSYDKIGNRLSELRDGQLPADTYHYAPNAAATGNTARLTQIDLTVGGTRDFTFGPAGHLEEVQAGANLIDFDSDDEGRMASLTRFSDNVTFTYDGRSFLASATEVGGDFVTPTYSSQGLLYSLFRSQDGGLTTSTRHVFYFASRPVASLETEGTSSRYTFLSTDHLGTPWVATDLLGEEVWSGGFEPFGRDWQRGTGQDAEENGVFLRFPGQWVDGTWEDASLGAEVYYNVHRWYEAGPGRYTRVDPAFSGRPLDREDFRVLSSTGGRLTNYGYGAENPLFWSDPLGLIITHVDPRWRGFLACAEAQGGAEFQEALSWMKTSPIKWEIRQLAPGEPMGRQARRFHDYGNPGTGSNTERPFLWRPGRVWIDPRRELTCEPITKSLVHEIREAYLAVGKRMSAASAHRSAEPPWDRDEAEYICSRCCPLVR